MAYQAEISRENPTCILFVIDQSGSMDEIMDSGRSKAAFVADVLNKTLYTLVTSCSKSDGVRNYFDVGVISYAGSQVASGFGGALSSEIVHPIHAISENTLRVEERKKKVDDGAGGIVELKTKFPVWFDPKSEGGTPMRAALGKTIETVSSWCEQHPTSYPPTILHVTDGQSTDGGPEDMADGLRRISTKDGEALLFNLHLNTAAGLEIVFPTAETALLDDYSRALFRMSSPLPAHLAKFAGDKGYTIADGSRGFIFNGDPQCVVDFFEIGTRPRLGADR
ncbi:VWA domain-containing protein [Bradyrhizobium sp.]|uniref:VWA domain-containing protein n=1 Tax=Bradyrhizobium sp. TaxID=376 RepID=UPI001EC53ACC|nr:VWA domain-containing protein [Bradyrhizobium sp.]MBV9981593.1 VWA domain-containing protein [Bradyrhizobium sp.]